MSYRTLLFFIFFIFPISFSQAMIKRSSYEKGSDKKNLTSREPQTSLESFEKLRGVVSERKVYLEEINESFSNFKENNQNRKPITVLQKDALTYLINCEARLQDIKENIYQKRPRDLTKNIEAITLFLRDHNSYTIATQLMPKVEMWKKWSLNIIGNSNVVSNQAILHIKAFQEEIREYTQNITQEIILCDKMLTHLDLILDFMKPLPAQISLPPLKDYENISYDELIHQLESKDHQIAQLTQEKDNLLRALVNFSFDFRK